MPNQKIFCNVPWTNLHIYWDGSYGVCCSEKMAPHQLPDTYNIKNMSAAEWYNSAPMRETRTAIKGDNKLTMCQGCYSEEDTGHESRRIKDNFKTAIFTEHAFDKSYAQSTFINDFVREDGCTNRQPIDWHVDLGTECNFACKMCFPRASSKIAGHYVKWGLIKNAPKQNWTLDNTSWNNFTNSILSTPGLNRIHIMGGEPLLSKKFYMLIEFLLAHKPNISFSFVTNGQLISDELIHSLQKFKSCDVEVSIESIYANNSYIRQGADTPLILSNIQKLVKAQTDKFKVVLRTAPQLLSVNNYDDVIRYALSNNISIQSIPVDHPKYLQISVLPTKIKHKLLNKYQLLNDELTALSDTKNIIVTGRNTAHLTTQLRRECNTIISMLTSKEPDNIDALKQDLKTWLVRWDSEYKLNALDIYPEYTEFLNDIGYVVQH